MDDAEVAEEVKKSGNVVLVGKTESKGRGLKLGEEKVEAGAVVIESPPVATAVAAEHWGSVCDQCLEYCPGSESAAQRFYRAFREAASGSGLLPCVYGSSQAFEPGPGLEWSQLCAALRADPKKGISVDDALYLYERCALQLNLAVLPRRGRVAGGEGGEEKCETCGVVWCSKDCREKGGHAAGEGLCRALRSIRHAKLSPTAETLAQLTVRCIAAAAKDESGRTQRVIETLCTHDVEKVEGQRRATVQAAVSAAQNALTAAELPTELADKFALGCYYNAYGVSATAPSTPVPICPSAAQSLSTDPPSNMTLAYPAKAMELDLEVKEEGGVQTTLYSVPGGQRLRTAKSKFATIDARTASLSLDGWPFVFPIPRRRLSSVLAALRALFKHAGVPLQGFTSESSVEMQFEINRSGHAQEFGSSAAAQVGLALHWIPSLINHSKEPSLLQQSGGSALTLTATRDLAPGDELTISYGGDGTASRYAFQ
eukprot:TRINITY_DN47607_c0_g1_i1.p1 TRINITY_DN47607_c0_g1~~TRINITY_DN47607_c0_g1_i1.p1  ORF type:complete len:485 (+),score=180.94 TRINITY_DN47607_c0_g1_i1:66-1520(+)